MAHRGIIMGVDFVAVGSHGFEVEFNNFWEQRIGLQTVLFEGSIVVISGII